MAAGSEVRELASAGEDSMEAIGERRDSFSLVEGSITSLYRGTSFRSCRSESMSRGAGSQTKESLCSFMCPSATDYTMTGDSSVSVTLAECVCVCVGGGF